MNPADLPKLATVVGVAIAAIAEADSSSESDDEEVKQPRSTPRKLPKSRQYFSQVDKMDDAEFMSHFRLSKGNVTVNIVHQSMSELYSGN